MPRLIVIHHKSGANRKFIDKIRGVVASAMGPGVLVPLPNSTRAIMIEIGGVRAILELVRIGRKTHLFLRLIFESGGAEKCEEVSFEARMEEYTENTRQILMAVALETLGARILGAADS
jgi:hypothetical protein